ncbi:MAG: hypothetical protein HY395_01425 [Candidatus Doudnabacteria bacterium]|nr:hypothetical protein [Candidatus Doudnabacteria bacterium]
MGSDKEQYAKLVCLFLAEQLRTRKISLHRAADIAQKVLNNINLLNDEHDFLRLIKELSKDFEELFRLEDRVFFWVEANERKNMEASVKTFAIEVIPQDPKLALEVMLEAIKEEVKLEDLKQKFPMFSDYLQRSQHG